MTPERERLVRDSWPLLEAASATASRTFYTRLFELDPAAATLFADADMEQQGRKFMAMLGSIIRSLAHAPTLVHDLAALSRRHVGYGVRDEHYESVGAALLWTVERVLGDACTPALRAAWVEAYSLMAAVMQRVAGAHGGALAERPAAGTPT